MRNQRGFTLVEAMMGMLLLGMIILAWLSLEVFTSKTVKQVADFSANQKVMMAVISDILTSERGLPPTDPPATFKNRMMNRPQLIQAFEALKNKTTRCYDRKAQIIDLNAKDLCYYVVSYFKFRVDDGTASLAGTDMDRIPLARIVVQVRYKDENLERNKDADPANDIWTDRFMTRLVANVPEF